MVYKKNKDCRYSCVEGKILMVALGKTVKCPDCHVEEDISTISTGGTTVHTSLLIPEQYHAFTSPTKEIFNFNELKSYTKESIDTVIHIMDNINKALYNEKIYKQSLYLVIPKMVDVYAFVYGSMLLGVEKGFTVSPFISLNMLHGLQRVGDFPYTDLKDVVSNKGLRDIHPELLNAVDGYRMVQETGLSYYDFITADVCFVEATANTTENGWKGLADLLAERSKRNKPTYVIGYWSHRSSQAGIGLKYLINSNTSTYLHKMTPYELQSAKYSPKASTNYSSLITNTGVEQSYGQENGLKAESVSDNAINNQPSDIFSL